MPVLLLGPQDKRDELARRVGRYFTPNEPYTLQAEQIIAVGWIVVALGWWAMVRPAILPSPVDILTAFPDLWTDDGLAQELVSSLSVSLQALVLAVAFSLPLAYLSRLPALSVLAEGVAGLRFLSPAVFFIVLLFAAGSGHMVKVLMLAMGESFFLVTAMLDVVWSVSEDELDDARTLRMNEWTVTWYVIVRGTLDQAFDMIRQNAAMGWAMLPMVEGIVRSEGGVGVLLVTHEKHLNFPQVYAIAVAIVLVGLGQDYTISKLKRLLCPWSVNHG